MASGGRRIGAGRPKKEQSQEILEHISKHINEEKVWSTLNELIAKGNLKAIQIFLDRKYGQPTSFAVQDVSIDNPQIPTIVFKSTDQINKDHQLKINSKK